MKTPSPGADLLGTTVALAFLVGAGYCTHVANGASGQPGDVSSASDPPAVVEFMHEGGMWLSESLALLPISLIRHGASNTAVSVDLATVDDSARAGQDYVATNTTVLFLPGVTNASVLLMVIDDAITEDTETFNVILSNPSAGAVLGGRSNTVVYLGDNDPTRPGRFRFSSASYWVGEADGSAQISVFRVGGSDVPATVLLLATDDSASAGSDFTATNALLTFEVGEVEKSVAVVVSNDSAPETDETVNLSLSQPTGGVTLLSPSAATLTIRDDDPWPMPGQFSLASSSFSVGESDGSAMITILRANGSHGSAAVRLSATGVSAEAGVDFIATNGVLSFGDQEVQKTFLITVLGDGALEGPETVALTLSEPTDGASLGSPTTALLNTLDDDAPPVCDAAALAAAVTNGGTYVFGCDATFELPATLNVTLDTTLDAGGHTVTLSGGDSRRIFSIAPGVTLRLVHLTLAQGAALGLDSPAYPATGGIGEGGAVLVNGGRLVAIDCRFLSNRAANRRGLPSLGRQLQLPEQPPRGQSCQHQLRRQCLRALP